MNRYTLWESQSVRSGRVTYLIKDEQAQRATVATARTWNEAVQKCAAMNATRDAAMAAQNTILAERLKGLKP